MTQILEFNNVSFQMQTPDNIVIISVGEHERLIKNDLIGKTWDMVDLRDRLKGAEPRWIKDNILYPYREELDVRNGGFVRYPSTKGKPWKFQAIKMAAFLDDHWAEFMEEK